MHNYRLIKLIGAPIVIMLSLSSLAMEVEKGSKFSPVKFVYDKANNKAGFVVSRDEIMRNMKQDEMFIPIAFTDRTGVRLSIADLGSLSHDRQKNPDNMVGHKLGEFIPLRDKITQKGFGFINVAARNHGFLFIPKKPIETLSIPEKHELNNALAHANDGYKKCIKTETLDQCNTKLKNKISDKFSLINVRFQSKDKK